jgi:uncharacterized iron-regulated membrane protein
MHGDARTAWLPWAPPSGSMSATRLYGVLWRWHFLAGLAACPILFVVALTGALYTFQPEFDPVLDSDLLHVEPGPTLVPADAVVAAGAAVCAPSGFVVPSRADLATTVYCPGGEERREIMVDPYRGRVLGERHPEATFSGVVFQLHWDLCLGDTGRVLVEWSTAWALLLMVSGAVLWWPRGRRRGGGVWWPRRGVASRQWLRDLHAVVGAYAVPVLLALAATGLAWTLHAGDKRWRPLTGDKVSATWKRPPPSTIVAGAPPIGFDRALAAAGIDLATEPLAVYGEPPAKPDGAYVFLVYDDTFHSPSRAYSVWIDAYSGAELARVTWDDHSTIGKINEAIFPIHVGALLGLPGRIAACLASLVLAALCVTGPWMWWKRRPRGRLGVPPRARRTPWALFVVLAGLGWLLPTVGYSLLAVVIIEGVLWIVRSRSTPLKPGETP